MKKLFKVLIALILIIAIGFGVYHIFLKKEASNKNVYYNINTLKNEIIVDDINVAENIELTIEQFKVEIVLNNYDLDQVLEYLDLYSKTKQYYSVVENHILETSVNLNRRHIKSYLKNSDTALDNMVEIYKSSYEYLKGTLYKGTIQKVYVEEFYSIFKNMLQEYTNFYLNNAYAYTFGLENTMLNNNLNRLLFSFYAELVDCFATLPDYRTQLEVYISNMKDVLELDKTKDYFDNKKIIDEVYNYMRDKKPDMQNLVVNISNNNLAGYIAGIEDEKLQNFTKNYCIYVLGMEVA